MSQALFLFTMAVLSQIKCKVFLCISFPIYKLRNLDLKCFSLKALLSSVNGIILLCERVSLAGPLGTSYQQIPIRTIMPMSRNGPHIAKCLEGREQWKDCLKIYKKINQTFRTLLSSSTPIHGLPCSSTQRSIKPAYLSVIHVIPWTIIFTL